MERIGFLINKLKEQYEKGTAQDALLLTVQMLYRELQPKIDGSALIRNIAIVVPGQMDLTFLEKNIEQKMALDLSPNDAGKQVFELSVEPVEPSTAMPEEKPEALAQALETQVLDSANTVEQSVPATATAPDVFISKPDKADFLPEPIVTADDVSIIKPHEHGFAALGNEAGPLPQKPETTSAPQPTPVVEVPHFTAPTTVTPPMEIHESISVSGTPSFNDQQPKRQPELFHTLKAEPLKDLKKAISINDRFQYISQLFRNDETAYERSIKTLNQFNIYSEAEFWIRRELSTKMGWNFESEVVKQFMALVQRRFA